MPSTIAAGATRTKSVRSFPLVQFKALDAIQGVFEGYLAVFNNEDLGGDVIQPGAFTKTIAELAAKQQHRAGLGAPAARYLLPIFWNHDPDVPIGGFTDLREDSVGLFVRAELDMDKESARDAYSGLSKGYVPGMSIGYLVMKPPTYKNGIRYLTELRLIEGSVTPIPMNEEALALEVKTATGKSSWPLGDRNRAWDNTAAHKRIVAWATDSDGNVDAAKLKSVHFYSPDGDAAENVSEYKLLFCDVVSGSVKAMPKGIFACAGSHGVEATQDIPADEQDAIKSKISAYYARMRKEFDDDSLYPSWEQQNGGKSMQRRSRKSQQQPQQRQQSSGQQQQQQAGAQRVKARSFEQVYNTDREAADLLEDLDDMWEALRESIVSILIEGSSSNGDNSVLAESLSQFGVKVTEWAQMAEMQDCWAEIADRAEDNADWYTEYATTPPDDPYYYGYMSRDMRRTGRKAGRAISQANHDHMSAAMQGMRDAHSAMDAHMKDMQELLDATAPNNAAKPSDATDTSQDTGAQSGDGKSAYIRGGAGAGAAPNNTPAGALAGNTTPQGASEQPDVDAINMALQITAIRAEMDLKQRKQRAAATAVA